MHKIEKISKKDARFYEIHLSTGESLRVVEAVLIRYNLHKEKILTAEQVRELQQASDFEAAYQQAINYLSWQLRTERELHIYLQQKAYSAEAIQSACQRLAELNLLNDQLYGESYVRTMLRTSDKGPQQIARQLQQKGLSEENIQQALELYSVEEQLQIAERVGEKLANRHRTRSYQEKQQKIRQGLQQKGFAGSIVDQVMNKLALTKDTEQEQDLLQMQGDKLWQRYEKSEPRKREQKICRALLQKGFDYDLIRGYIQEKNEKEENN